MLLELQSRNFIHSVQNFENNIDHQKAVQQSLSQEMIFLNSQLQILQDIKQKNNSLVGAINNLFELIPEQITINTISLDHDTLTLKGITPSKELYIFLLEAPLKAIFSESKVDFFVLPSGWYNFVSVSKVIPIKVDHD